MPSLTQNTPKHRRHTHNVMRGIDGSDSSGMRRGKWMAYMKMEKVCVMDEQHGQKCTHSEQLI